MTAREKIIVGMMCVTIVYGAYELLSSGSSLKKPPAVAPDTTSGLQNLVTDISKQLSNEKEDGNRLYLAKMAASAWTKDPFIQSTQPLKKKIGGPAEMKSNTTKAKNYPKLYYSGFLEVGQIKLAIINGLEYSEGEALETTGYYVRSISAQHVIIGKINSSDTIRLPLREVAD